MRRNQFFYILFVVSLVGILGFSYANKRSPVTSCHSWGFISAKAEKYYTYPEKLVVQPWRGQHHVYGIFMVPNGHTPDYLITVTLPETKTYCGTINYGRSNSMEGISAKPGHYLVKGYLNTRIALWWIAHGKVDQLKQPSNWKLGYTKKEQT
ncbi:MAG: hypothetical protein KME32_15640 [Mojavia pulchra JT2-VF2]|uniref:Uncharacterized protein n=1 Tax=Mojavia pulchra JT2-VF2 TaxID=287848 RepID=A0A951UGI3_9NOST|nr:hypothetical protein [Mojavia pulchra JT2-VF2]